jgi:pyruvate-ferredoxin/flavodoxin oxidoreductase
VDSGHWPLLRFNPEEARLGRNPLQIDSGPPRVPLREYAYREMRYKVLQGTHPEEARRLLDLAQRDVDERWRRLQEMAAALAGHDAA